jgi:HD-like signal output (HDOD) protein
MPILTKRDIQELSMKLPAVSTVAMQMISLIEDLRTSRQEIIELLKLDEVLFAECFRHANSASVSSFRKFVTINEIVDVLGFSHIKKVALFTAAKSVIDDPKVWFESVFVAIAADHLARKNRFDYHLCDIVYMAALFQNFGSFLLSYFYPKIYRNLNKIVDYDERLKAQEEEFGYHSLDISILVLKNYNVPEYVIDVIRNQINVYTDKARKENVFIEIARVLQEMQNKPMRDIHKVLETARVRRAMLDSGIEMVRVDHDMISLLKENAATFV